jgi:hypothetical protein
VKTFFDVLGGIAVWLVSLVSLQVIGFPKNVGKKRPMRWRVSFRIAKLTQSTAERDQTWKSKELAR